MALYLRSHSHVSSLQIPVDCCDPIQWESGRRLSLKKASRNPRDLEWTLPSQFSGAKQERPESPDSQLVEMSLVRPYIVGCLVMVVPEAKVHHAVSRTGEHPASSVQRKIQVLLRALDHLLRGCFLAHQPGPICPLGFLSPSLHSGSR